MPAPRGRLPESAGKDVSRVPSGASMISGIDSVWEFEMQRLQNWNLLRNRLAVVFGQHFFFKTRDGLQKCRRIRDETKYACGFDTGTRCADRRCTGIGTPRVFGRV